MFQQTEWVIPSGGFFSKAIECDALVQNGAFFMELDAANTLGQIEKGINPDIIGAISPSRKFALIYQGEIVAQGSRYDKVYQKTLMDLRRASYDVKKVGEILEDLIKQIKVNKIIEEDGWAVIRGIENENVAKAWLDSDGEFNISIVTKNTSLEKNGRKIFKNLFNFINNEYDEIFKIRGTWRASKKNGDNLYSFNEFIKAGMTPENAAKRTFTGKMANELGFTNVKIEDTTIKNSDGIYISVDVIFLKN